MKKTILLFICMLTIQWVSSQNVQVSGTVTDKEDGSPLIGVNVVVKGEKGMGTVTDFDGKFTMDIPQGKSLTFSYIGYMEQVKQVKENGTLNIILQPDAKMLNEVVAVGYGTMKKSDLTGSVTSISAAKLKQTPVSGIDQALQGRAAGVTVNANSGQPGAAAQVRIRGIGTINSNAAPIYVVDGVILDDISFLSPSDIQATEVLKDASATAIFGSRGANGVILITTKQGSDNPKGNITVDTYFGFQNRWKKLDLMKRDEFAFYVSKFEGTGSHNIFLNDGLNTWLTKKRIGTKSYFFPKIKTDTYPQGMDYASQETDWQDEVFVKNALIQNHYISFDGGSKTSTYAISGAWFDQQGTIIGSYYKRLTLRVNTSHKVRSWLKIGENLSFMNSTGRNAMNNSSSPGASVLSAALAMAPWDPTHYPDGSWSYPTFSAGYPNGRNLGGQISASSNFSNVVNPFSMVENSKPINKSERWVGDIYMEINPIKKITVRSDVSLDLANISDKLFKSAYVYSSYDRMDTSFFSTNMARYYTLINENTATYADKIGKHDFSIMIGQTSQEWDYYSLGGSGKNITSSSSSNYYLFKTQLTDRSAADGVNRTRMFSLLGRIHYQFNNKYMITGNIRRDGSNKFPENTYGVFPSTALGWKISEEPFMKAINNLDFLKLRLGWGQIGNEKIGNDLFVTKMTEDGPYFVDYVLGTSQSTTSGATVLTYANQGGKWETTEQWNGGVDFGFFKGLISGTVDVFLKDTKEALISVKGPAYVGNRFDALANAGTIRNQGIEIALDHKNKIGQVNYNLNGNISFIKNELTSLKGGPKIWSEGNILLSDEGLPLYTIWGYVYEGVFDSDAEAQAYTKDGVMIQPNTKGGDAKYKDINDDGKIDENDKTDIGNPFPWLTYAFSASFDWKGFDFQLFFQGIYGNEIYNAVRLRTESDGLTSTLSTSMRDVWTIDNTTGSIPNPIGNANNDNISSRFVENGSYLRLKNIQLGYTLPKNLTQKISIDRCRLYVSASNLLTFTKYTGYDPEIGSGVDYGNYPQARTILFGANLNF